MSGEKLNRHKNLENHLIDMNRTTQNNFLYSSMLFGIQSKKNSLYRKLFEKINDESSEMASIAERNFLKTINANCNSPISVYARIENQEINIDCQIFKHDGTKLFKKTLTEKKQNYHQVGNQMGELVLKSLGQSTIDKLDILEDDFNYSTQD